VFLCTSVLSRIGLIGKRVTFVGYKRWLSNVCCVRPHCRRANQHICELRSLIKQPIASQPNGNMRLCFLIGRTIPRYYLLSLASWGVIGSPKSILLLLKSMFAKFLSVKLLEGGKLNIFAENIEIGGCGCSETQFLELVIFWIG